MQITIDTMKDSHEDIRNAAAFLLHLIGDLNDEPEELARHTHTQTTTETATVGDVSHTITKTLADIPAPPSGLFVPPPPPLVPADSTSDEGNGEETGYPASNVLPFPVPPPPPPPPSTSSVDTAAPRPPAPPASTAAGVSTVVSVEVDSAGMPYDARIHQKGKGKKKDLTWKLIKGIDPAVVAAVTAELAASKGASAPVSLPQGQGPVPVPPVPPANGAATASVPTPPTPPAVPVPPVAAVGAVSPYRALIERITAATKEGKITPARVNELCQLNGVPNLMQLNNMPDKLPDVSTMIDATIAGLA